MTQSEKKGGAQQREKSEEGWDKGRGESLPQAADCVHSERESRPQVVVEEEEKEERRRGGGVDIDY